jgi:hypothetical protein
VLLLLYHSLRQWYVRYSTSKDHILVNKYERDSLEIVLTSVMLAAVLPRVGNWDGTKTRQ